MKNMMIIVGALLCLACHSASAQALTPKEKFCYKENSDLTAQERKLLYRMAVEEAAVEKDKTIFAWEYVAPWLKKCDRGYDLSWSECVCPKCHEHLIMFSVREYYRVGPKETHYRDNIDVILFICPHCRDMIDICLID